MTVLDEEEQYQEPILQTRINFDSNMSKWGITLPIHYQNSVAAPLQFGNGYVISSHILWLT